VGTVLLDNGPPFVAPRGLRGLSTLSVWWIRLGIRPLRTEPAHPHGLAGFGLQCAMEALVWRESHRPALQPLPGDLQPGASARSARTGPSGLALAALTAPVPGASPALFFR
jgi:hypothetical protein